MLASNPAVAVSTSPEEALAERVRRERARRYFGDFMRYMLPEKMVPMMARHHEMLAWHLDQVSLYIETGGKEGIGRLMVFWPPRYWKTLSVSRLFPPYLLGRMPDAQIVLTSYGGDLAFKNSRNARDFLTDKKFRAVFGDKAARDLPPVELAQDARSVQSWTLAKPFRGGVRAAGVGGGLTGEGGHLIVIDDPFKNREEAERETRREEIWDWWTDSVYTRREDGAAIVIPQTRWHVDGLSGRLLKKMAEDPLADRWVVLSLPALWEAAAVPEEKNFEQFQREKMKEGVWIDFEDPLGRRPGEALWPDKHDEEELTQIRANMGPYGFESLYQQQPYLKAGNLFKREYFGIVDEPPKPDEISELVRYWDKAATKDAGAFTAGLLMARTVSGFYYVLHVARGQWSPGQRDAEMVKIANQDREEWGYVVQWHEQEPGGSGRDSAEATNDVLSEAGHEAHFQTATGDKVERAGPWSSKAEAGKVRVLRAGWTEAYIDEHISFPKGKYKDQVDGSSGGFGRLREGVLEGELMA